MREGRPKKISIFKNLKDNKKNIISFVMIFIMSYIVLNVLCTYTIQFLGIGLLEVQVISSCISFIIAKRFGFMIEIKAIRKSYLYMIISAIIMIIIWNQSITNVKEGNLFVQENLIEYGTITKPMKKLVQLLENGVLNNQDYEGSTQVAENMYIHNMNLESSEPIGPAVYYSQMRSTLLGDSIGSSLLILMCISNMYYIYIMIYRKNKRLGEYREYILLIALSVITVIYACHFEIFWIYMIILNTSIWINYFVQQKRDLSLNLIVAILPIYLLGGIMLFPMIILNIIILLKENRKKAILGIGLAIVLTINLVNKYIEISNLKVSQEIITYIIVSIYMVVFIVGMGIKKVSRFIVPKMIYCGVFIVSIILSLISLVTDRNTIDISNEYNRLVKEQLNKEDILVVYDKGLINKTINLLAQVGVEVIPINSTDEAFKIQNKLGNKEVYYLGNKLNLEQKINLDKENKEKVHVLNIKEYLGEIYKDKELDTSEIAYAKGIYDNSTWTSGDFILEGDFGIESQDQYLIIETVNSNNPLRIRGELDIQVFINGLKSTQRVIAENELEYFFEIPSGVNNIYKIEILTNTFIPKNEGINGDGRELGIDIKSIKVN